MTNINPVILEYGMLLVIFIGIVVLMVTKVVDANTGVPIITAVLAYAVGSAKGAATTMQVARIAAAAMPDRSTK